MPFEIVTTLKHFGPFDPEERVTIQLSEGRWRNLVCVNRPWNNTKVRRLQLVRSTWPRLVIKEAEELVEKVNQRGRSFNSGDVQAWVGRPGQPMFIGDVSPSIQVMIGTSLNQSVIRLPGRIAGFKLHPSKGSPS